MPFNYRQVTSQMMRSWSVTPAPFIPLGALDRSRALPSISDARHALDQRKYARAIDIFESQMMRSLNGMASKSITLLPEIPTPQLEASGIGLMAAHLERGLERLQQTSSTDHDWAEMHFERAVDLWDASRPDLFSDTEKKNLAQLFFTAGTHLQMKDGERPAPHYGVISLYMTALQIDPALKASPDPVERLTDYLLSFKNPDLIYQTSVQIASALPRAAEFMARLRGPILSLFKKGAPEPSVFDLSSVTRGFIHLDQIFIPQKDPKLIPLIEAIVQAVPHSPERTKNVQKAIDYIHRQLREESPSPFMWIYNHTLGILYFESPDTKKARHVLENIVRDYGTNPHFFEHHWILGSLLIQDGQCESGRAHLQTAFDLLEGLFQNELTSEQESAIKAVQGDIQQDLAPLERAVRVRDAAFLHGASLHTAEPQASAPVDHEMASDADGVIRQELRLSHNVRPLSFVQHDVDAALQKINDPVGSSHSWSARANEGWGELIRLVARDDLGFHAFVSAVEKITRENLDVTAAVSAPDKFHPYFASRIIERALKEAREIPGLLDLMKRSSLIQTQAIALLLSRDHPGQGLGKLDQLVKAQAENGSSDESTVLLLRAIRFVRRLEERSERNKVRAEEARRREEIQLQAQKAEEARLAEEAQRAEDARRAAEEQAAAEKAQQEAHEQAQIRAMEDETRLILGRLESCRPDQFSAAFKKEIDNLKAIAARETAAGHIAAATWLWEQAVRLCVRRQKFPQFRSTVTALIDLYILGKHFDQATSLLSEADVRDGLGKDKDKLHKKLEEAQTGLTPAERAYAVAEDLYSTGKYREAADAFGKLINDFPVDARLGQGTCLGRMGKHVDAIRILHAAFELEPTNVNVIKVILQIYLASGETEEAETVVISGLNLSGRAAILLAMGFRIFARRNKFDEARSMLEELLAVLPSLAETERVRAIEDFDTNFMDLGNHFTNSGHPELSIEFANLAMEAGYGTLNVDMTKGMALGQLSRQETLAGQAEKGQQRLEEAIAHFRSMMERYSDSYYGEFGMANVLRLHGRYVEAAPFFDQAYQKASHSGTAIHHQYAVFLRHYAAHVFENGKDMVALHNDLKTARDLYDQTITISQQAMDVVRQSSHPDKALIAEAVEIANMRMRAHYERQEYRALISFGRAFFSRFSEIPKGDAARSYRNGFIVLGRACYKLGLFTEARAEFEKAIQVARSHGVGIGIMAHLEYAHCLLGIPSPQYDKAQKIFGEAQKDIDKQIDDLKKQTTFPDDVRILWVEQASQIISEVSLLLKESERHPADRKTMIIENGFEVFIRVVNLMETVKAYAEARSLGQRLTTYWPERPEGFVMLGHVLTAWFGQDPSDGTLIEAGAEAANRAIALADNGKSPQNIKNQAHAVISNAGVHLKNAADQRAAHGDYEAAKKWLSLGIRFLPDEEDLHCILTFVELGRGDLVAARTAFSELARIFKNKQDKRTRGLYEKTRASLQLAERSSEDERTQLQLDLPVELTWPPEPITLNLSAEIPFSKLPFSYDNPLGMPVDVQKTNLPPGFGLPSR